jgi:hypothetical protein
MSEQPKTAPPEIASAQALNDAAARNGWPMLADETCDFTNPMLRELFSLWQGEAAAGGIPHRQALTARKLQPFMRSIALYECVGDGPQRRYRVRLMGSGMVQYYGELTGRFLDDVVPEKYLPRWYALCDLATGAGRPARVLLRADTFDKAYIVTEYLTAPLRAENGAAKFILLGTHFDGRRPWSEVEAEARRKLGLNPPP